MTLRSVVPAFLEAQAVEAFSEDARRAVYDVIALRRDVRHFKPDVSVPDATLKRILQAAHLAPSVGFSQPWGFVIVRDVDTRARIRRSFLACREAESQRFPEERRREYLAHKLEGVLDSALNVCVAVDLRPQGESILGTTVQPESVRASVCCAVQNLWLAARAEGIGVGWVSIVEPAVLRTELRLPRGVEPIAYLCLGVPVAFRERPMLEETGWRARVPVESVIHADGHWKEAPGVDPPRPPLAARNAPVPELDVERAERVRAYQRELAKPLGSLGRLEELTAWCAAVRGEFPIRNPEKNTLCLFAGDHGVAEEGVSAYGSPVTAAVLANVMSGGSAVNQMASLAGIDIRLVDVGVAGDLTSVSTRPVVALERRAVRSGTRNLAREPAMTRSEVLAAMAVGAEVAAAAIADGSSILGVGEIGIGNTTSAAALTCAFTGIPANRLVGFGTGIGDGVRARKGAVIEAALALHHPDPADPIGVLALVGGLEIAALVGCMLESARLRTPVVLDGVVTNAAALAAVAMDRGVTDYLLASHASPEPAAAAALAHLHMKPLLDFGLRLGEGTGAVLGISILRTAVVTVQSMATFATAGIVGRAGLGGEKAEA